MSGHNTHSLKQVSRPPAIARLGRAVVLLCCSLSTGCAFDDLKDDLGVFDTVSTIRGSLEATTRSDKPVLVALYEPREDDEYHLEAFSVGYGSREFEFLVPSGSYFLVAFEDANEDLTFQDHENVGWYGAPTLIDARPGDTFDGLDVTLRAPEQAKRELPALYKRPAPYPKLEVEDGHLGDVVDADDPRLSLSVGNMGMWEPIKFVQQGYHGVYFLEPYNPNKIPVLFIHGMRGSGAVWRHLIDSLDTERFQAWIVQYPSAFRLSLLSRRINEAVNQLRLRHQFEQLIVVAHSMGGLIARDFISRNAAQGGRSPVKLFVSLSTPWGGHSAARLGVATAPTVVPSWYDMVPGSPYLGSLLESPLPSDIAYYLLFSYRGTRSLLESKNHDGTVTLRSQLPKQLQREASKVIAYDENHVSITRSDEVANDLHEIMLNVASPLN